MNAKHLFLTITLLFASVSSILADKTDEITYAAMNAEYGAEFNSPDYNEFSGCSIFESDAVYSGWIYYNNTTNVLGLNSANILATTGSGGIVRRVRVYWAASGNNEYSRIYVYGSHSAINGTELEQSDLEEDPSIIYLGRFDYDAGDEYGEWLITSSDYEYVAVTGEGNTYFTEIEILWEVLSTYTASIGTVLNSSYGTVTVSTPMPVTEGEIVTVNFTPKKNKRLDSFSLDGMEFDLSCMGYVENKEAYAFSFPMPARDVTIDVNFTNIAPERIPNDITFYDDETPLDPVAITAESGVDKLVTFTLAKNGTTDPVYDGTVQYIISDASKLSVSDFTVDAAGNGSFIVKALQPGSATVTVKALRSIYVAEKTKALTVTVTPRETALVSEYDGSYYVSKNTISAGKFGAIEVYKSNDYYWYDVAGDFDESDVTWYISTLDIYGSQSTIQNKADKYLAVSGSNFLFQDSSNPWNDDEGRYKEDASEKGFIYSAGKFTTSKDMTYGAKDVLLNKFRPMTYSTVSGAGIVDKRTLAPEDWGTLCVPFNVSSANVSTSGATFYELTGKHVEGDVLVGIYISDPMTELVAGHSYLYQINKGSSSIVLTGSTAMVNEAVIDDADGFVGCLPGNGASMTVPAGMPNGDDTEKYNGCYGVSKGKLRYVAKGSTGTIKPYRAYIDASELGEPAPAPGRSRRMIMNVDYQGSYDPGVATSIIEVSDVMLIDWNQPVYNIMGVQVGKGATGVLIQNGQKFLVQ